MISSWGRHSHQWRSISSWQVMQYRVHGIASKRLVPISWPQFRHSPKVPASIWSKAPLTAFRRFSAWFCCIADISVMMEAVARSPSSLISHMLGRWPCRLVTTRRNCKASRRSFRDFLNRSSDRLSIVLQSSQRSPDDDGQGYCSRGDQGNEPEPQPLIRREVIPPHSWPGS